jgi:hypothetical protein
VKSVAIFPLIVFAAFLAVFLIGMGAIGLWLLDGKTGIVWWLATIAIAVGIGLLFLCPVLALLARKGFGARQPAALPEAVADDGVSRAPQAGQKERILDLLTMIRALNQSLDIAVAAARRQTATTAGSSSPSSMQPAIGDGDTAPGTVAPDRGKRTLH